jgi:hypothetical protein
MEIIFRAMAEAGQERLDSYSSLRPSSPGLGQRPRGIRTVHCTHKWVYYERCRLVFGLVCRRYSVQSN